MNISFCTVVLSLIQGIALNTEVPPCSQGWGATMVKLASGECLGSQALETSNGGSSLCGNEEVAL
jgi:hypothetical protein